MLKNADIFREGDKWFMNIDEIEKKLGYKVRIVADTKGE